MNDAWAQDSRAFNVVEQHCVEVPVVGRGQLSETQSYPSAHRQHMNFKMLFSRCNVQSKRARLFLHVFKNLKEAEEAMKEGVGVERPRRGRKRTTASTPEGRGDGSGGERKRRRLLLLRTGGKEGLEQRFSGTQGHEAALVADMGVFSESENAFIPPVRSIPH